MERRASKAKAGKNSNRVRLPYNFKRKTLLRDHANAPQRLVDAGLTHDEWATFYGRLFPIHDMDSLKCLKWLTHSNTCGLDLLCCIPCIYDYFVRSRKNKTMGEWADDFNAQVLHKYQIFLKLQTRRRHVEKRFEGELPQDYDVEVAALVFALGESEIGKLKTEPNVMHINI